MGQKLKKYAHGSDGNTHRDDAGSTHTAMLDISSTSRYSFAPHARCAIASSVKPRQPRSETLRSG